MSSEACECYIFGMSRTGTLHDCVIKDHILRTFTNLLFVGKIVLSGKYDHMIVYC